MRIHWDRLSGQPKESQSTTGSSVDGRDPFRTSRFQFMVRFLDLVHQYSKSTFTILSGDPSFQKTLRNEGKRQVSEKKTTPTSMFIIRGGRIHRTPQVGRRAMPSWQAVEVCKVKARLEPRRIAERTPAGTTTRSSSREDLE